MPAGGPPPPRLIRLITEVYGLPIEELRGAARSGRLDRIHAECVRRNGG